MNRETPLPPTEKILRNPVTQPIVHHLVWEQTVVVYAEELGGEDDGVLGFGGGYDGGFGFGSVVGVDGGSDGGGGGAGRALLHYVGHYVGGTWGGRGVEG